jgi:hypothetical protein
MTPGTPLLEFAPSVRSHAGILLTPPGLRMPSRWFVLRLGVSPSSQMPRVAKGGCHGDSR